MTQEEKNQLFQNLKNNGVTREMALRRVKELEEVVRSQELPKEVYTEVKQAIGLLNEYVAWLERA